jgi:hypothetical protein
MTDSSSPTVDRAANVTRNVPPPFFALASWWRRFLFWTLRPREITVYLYIVSLLDKNGTAFPSQAQMAYEMNLAGTDQISNALEVLERNGFLLRTRGQLEGRRTSSERTIYSRPAIEFTLIALLDRGKIDGRLYPTNKKSELIRDELDTTESAVALGLRNLLGPTRYSAYVAGGETSSVLREQLVAILDERLGYKTWIETIYSAIHEKLGGDAEQSGSLRRYGKADFSISMDYKTPYGEGEMGVVQAAVILSDGPLRRRGPTVKYNRYAHSPLAVADEMLHVYDELIAR